MTVSPMRQSDGSRPLDVARDRDSSRDSAESGSLSDSLTMPPVLFKLRNLKPASSAKPVPQEPGLTKQSRSDRTEHGDVQNGPPTSRLQKNQVSDSQRVATVDQKPIERNSIERNSIDRNSVDRTVAPLETTRERPSGRTWTETAAANRNVLVMLAIVIAIALWTSRNGSAPAEPDTALADANDMLSIDAGDLVAGAPSFVSEVAATDSAPLTINRPGKSDSSSNANPSGNATNTPVSVSLQSPQSVLPPASKNVAAVNDSFDEFGTQASHVSSRKLNDDFTDLSRASDLLSQSSMDSHLGDDVSDSAAWQTTPTAAPVAETPGPALSQTPASVGDWLRFLPPAPNQ